MADAFSDLTVIFVDIVSFSSLAQRLSPGHLVKLLNDFFAFEDTLRMSREHEVDLRTAAYMLAVGRVAEATLTRGIYP